MLTWIGAPLPLAAAEGGAGGLLSVDTTLLVSTAILFALFAWVLGKFAWGPLLRIVDDREQNIRTSVETAERAAAEAKETLEQHQEMLRGAGRERGTDRRRRRKQPAHRTFPPSRRSRASWRCIRPSRRLRRWR